jgi:flagellar biosynthesis/type III secretory pathway protein FliH
MILRDAIFSADRRHLGAQAAPAPAATDALAVTLNEVHEMGATYEARPAEAPMLSSDRVASWLVTQDGATRTALAAMLSDELAVVRDAAHEEGYARGHAEAMKEAREKVGAAIAALESIH